jgi:hypothetical protein
MEKDAKSIVAVGAMIGNYASSRGSLDGFALNLKELIMKMLSTTDYFSKSENDKPFMAPNINTVTIEVSQFPLRIWTRQLDAFSYPTRPFYILDFNEDRIKERIKVKLALNDNDKRRMKDAVNDEIERLRKLSPFKLNIVRENFPEDKETLKIESAQDSNLEDVPSVYFSLQIQSMSEAENYWLDSGEFSNLRITKI